MAEENSSDKQRANACGDGVGAGLTIQDLKEELRYFHDHQHERKGYLYLLEELLASMQREVNLREALKWVKRCGRCASCRTTATEALDGLPTPQSPREEFIADEIEDETMGHCESCSKVFQLDDAIMSEDGCYFCPECVARWVADASSEYSDKEEK